MKKLAFYSVLFLVASQSQAQTNPYWQWLGPPDSEEVDNIYASGDTIFAGGIAHLWRTFDAGKTWSIIDSAIGNPKPDTVQNCYACPGPDSTIYPPGSGGVASISVSAKDPSLIYIAKGKLVYAQGGGLFKSINAGKSWRLVSDTTDTATNPYSFSGIRAVYSSPFDTSTIFAIRETFAGFADYDDLYRSTDGGTNWSYVSAGFPSSEHGSKIGFAFDPSDSMKMYATDDNNMDACLFYASTDGGETWLSRSNCPGTLGFFKADTSWDILGWGGTQVISSTDGGFTWNGPIKASYYNFNIDYMQYVPRIPKVYYAACDYYDSLSGPEHVGIYRSTDSLRSWTLLNGSSDLPISAFAYSGNLKLYIDAESRNLYVSSTKGLFKYYEPVTGIQSLNISPSQFRLYPNYPNPFNPTTTITYTLCTRVHVQITVYNDLGQEVKKLVDAQQAAGNYSVVLNGDGLASGPYFYVLHAGTTVLLGKALLLK